MFQEARAADRRRILKRNTRKGQAPGSRPCFARRASAFLIFLVSFVFAAPALANNTFPGTTISGNSGSLLSNNNTATGETGEPATFGGGNLNTMWYSWTAAAGGSLTVETCSATQTTFDTTLNSHTGAAVNALTALVGNDDACANTTVNPYASRITFDVISGTPYRIQVDGYNNALGAFLLTWNFTPRTIVIANTTNGAETGPVNGVMTLTQSSTSATATVVAYTVSGTAASGADFTALSGTATIAAGATTVTIPIPVINDAIVEGSETVIVTLTGVTSGAASLGGTVAVTNTIADNDSATVTIANTTNGAEPATNGAMTVTQTAVSATNTVIAYSVGGTASPGGDYTALSGTVTILAGATTATVPIPVLNDSTVEPGETVVVTLTSVTSGLATLGATLVATNTITSDDAATVSIANTTNAAEPATNGVLTVTQTNPSATNTVIAYSVAGTATSGTDYTALSGTVTILAGATTATISIPVLDDPVVEGGETVIVTLTSVTSGLASLGAPLAATNTISDNDSATVNIANTTDGAETGPANGVMTVTQSSLSATNTVISYTVGGTASSGADYTALSGSVTILAGATTATITIPVLNDVIVEGSETAIVTLTSVTSGLATLGAPLTATNTIADNDTGTIVVVNTDNAATETAGNTGAFTVALGLQPSVSVTVTIGASAQCGYAPTTLTFTTANWNVAQTVTVTPNDDAIVEGPHTCSPATISASGGAYTGVTATPPVTNITDNDTAAVTIANTTNAAEPAANGVMTVTQSAVSVSNSVISYTVSGTATSASDYTALSGTVTIPAGATTATISIPVLDDAIVEGGETVTVTLTSVTSGLATLGATLIATNTIADNDSASVTIANTTNAAEPATNGVMTLTQTAVSSQDTVLSYLVSGTAISGSDYTALSGTVTIPAGATTATISIPVLDDAIVEGGETVTVTLTSVTSGLATLGATLFATNTIADNDSASVTIANTTNAAEPATDGVMTLTQTAVSSQATVISYLVSGTAISGSDYTALSGTVTIPAGATTATISIPVLNDLVVEPSETVTVTLSAVTSGLATLGATIVATNTIADDDSATVTIANTTNAVEPATNGVMTLTQSAVASQNTVISYTVSGTATSAADYTALSGTVTIPAGSTTATISIPVLDDAIVEGGETVTVTFTSVTSGLATLGATLIATNTIADNDSATVTIANTTDAAEPSTNGEMTLTQTAVSSQDTVLSYLVSGTAISGSDYTVLSGTVTIPAGATMATISILVLNDLVVEPTETLTVTLSAVTSGLATLGATLVATNTIADNDIASFTIAKAVNTATISAPSTLAYSITIDNTGNVPLTGLSISDTLLQGGSPRALTSGPAYASGDTNSDAILDASETWIYSASYAVPQGDIDNGTAFSNIAVFDTAETAALASNAAATAITQTPSITVAKSANVASVNFPGDPIIYSVLVTNSGNVTATAITVTDPLISLICPASGNSMIASLAPGGSETCTATYPAAQSDFDTNGGGDGDIDNTASASGTAAGSPVSDSDSATVALTPAPQLTLSKTADTAGPLTVGQVINYTYTVTNTGNVTISSVDVNETAFNGNGTPAPSPVPGGPTTLAPGGILAFSATYTVTQSDIDQLQ